MEKLVGEELQRFARVAGVDDDDVKKMNTDETETLLKKLLACSLGHKEVAMYVCAYLDPDTVRSMNRDAFSYNADPTVFGYIFANAEMPPNESMDILSNFKKHVSIRGDNEAIRAFHALNAPDMREHCLDIAGNNDRTRANTLTNEMRRYKKRFPLDTHLNEDWALVLKSISFPFLHDGRVYIGGTSGATVLDQKHEVHTPKLVDTIPFVDTASIDSKIDINKISASKIGMDKIIKVFRSETNLPLAFPEESIIKQMTVAMIDTVPEAILHRNQTPKIVSETVSNLLVAHPKECINLIEHHINSMGPVPKEILNDDLMCKMYYSLDPIETTTNAFLASYLRNKVDRDSKFHEWATTLVINPNIIELILK